MHQERGKGEALEALRRIREAEETARRIVRDAQEQTARKIIRDACEDAQQMREHHMKEARQRAHEIKSTMISEARQEAEKIRKEAAEEARVLSRKTEALMPRVVEKVAERIRAYVL
jgi:vacuolar-type H+-ATPase subunit H